MSDRPANDLPIGATRIELAKFEPSDELAGRLADAGASAVAIEAAGGRGAAARLLERTDDGGSPDEPQPTGRRGGLRSAPGGAAPSPQDPG